MILSKLGYLHADLAINRGFNRNHHLSNLLSLQVGGGPAGIIGILAGILLSDSGRHERPAIGLVHDPIAHELHVIEITRDILNDFDIVVRTVLF